MTKIAGLSVVENDVKYLVLRMMDFVILEEDVKQGQELWTWITCNAVV